MLQLRLLLVDVLHRELLGAIALVQTDVLVRGLWGGEAAAVRGEQRGTRGGHAGQWERIGAAEAKRTGIAERGI